jgi:hypothetical protein
MVIPQNELEGKCVQCFVLEVFLDAGSHHIKVSVIAVGILRINSYVLRTSKNLGVFVGKNLPMQNSYCDYRNFYGVNQP